MNKHFDDFEDAMTAARLSFVLPPGTQPLPDIAVDQFDRPIRAGAIVEISYRIGGALLKGHQGLVINPRIAPKISNVSYAGKTSIFFNQEFPFRSFETRFSAAHFESLDRWDLRNGERCKHATDEELIKNPHITTIGCPRIVYFDSRDLILSAEWSVFTLAKRFFPKVYAWHDFGRNVSRGASRYKCWVRNCKNNATKTAVFCTDSVWPYYVCDTCHRQINGKRFMFMIPCKDSVLGIDGRECRPNHGEHELRFRKAA